MRAPRSIAIVLLGACCAVGGCQLLAGIEDLQLTGAALDASGGDATGDVTPGSDGTSPDSPGGPEGGAGDAPVDALLDGGADSRLDGPSIVDAAEAGLTYAEEVMLDHPLAYWRFGEMSGTTAIDSSGHGVTGTYEGGVTLGATGAIANDPDKAATFDGMTGFMNAGDVFAFTGAVPCSFEAWVNPVLDDSYHEVLSRSDGQGGSTTGYLMYVERDSDPAMVDFALYSSGTGNIAESNTPIVGGVYTHLVGEYDGSMVYIYGNGVLLQQAATSFTTPATSSAFVVAAQSGGLTGWFHGSIDEVAVYGAVLPANRVLAHYRVGIGLPPQ